MWPLLFVQCVTSNLRKVPREGWLLGFLSASLSAGTDLTYWATRWPINWMYAAPFMVLILTWTGAIYVSACKIAERECTNEGYVRFVLATLTLTSPVGASLLIFFTNKAAFLNAGPVLLLLLMALLVILVIPLFTAWPMAEAITLKSISPLRVCRATRGHRGSLIFISFTSTGIGNGKFIPPMSMAQSFIEAVLIGVAHIFPKLIAMALIASITATAWTFAMRNDPGLG